MIKRGLLGLLFVLASSVVVMAPASAANPCDPSVDITAPTYRSASMTPSAIVVGQKARTVRLDVKVSDNCGMKYIIAQLLPHGSTPGGPIYFPSLKLVSGTGTSGTWSATTTVGAWAKGGLWDALYLKIEDSNFNITVGPHKVPLVIRHTTTTNLYKPTAKVKRNTSVTLKGYVAIAGEYKVTRAQVQVLNSHKHWSFLKAVRTDSRGNFAVSVKVTGKTTYRVVHNQDGSTTASKSTSRTISVK